MKSYIDDYNLIRIEDNSFIESVYLLDEQLTYLKTEANNQFFVSNKEIPLHLADKITINNNEYDLKIGNVTLKPHFNEKYRYDGNLGSEYYPNKTIFKVFSPVLKEAFVVINDISYPMTYTEPIWHAEVLGDFDKATYYYNVRVNNTFQKVADPYALAGGLEESIVIDLNKTKPMTNNFLDFKVRKEAVIYEGHIRDLTYNLDVIDKTNYLGLVNEAKELKTSVIEYIKDLGMTHLQLLPVQDFIGVNELNKEESYNWGYNPQSYFTLTGWFSNNPKDPYARINEFKTLVDFAHQKNLGINVDVVYNHVYERGMYPYDKLVPGYFYRHDKAFNPSDSGGVGNDVETTNYMVRKLIIDSLEYLTKTFKIDGYRFDLMGLMDIETMDQIEVALKAINPNIMLYGEGWNMNNPIDNSLRSHMFNSAKFPYYGHFNDVFRNTIKGNQHELSRGYAVGGTNYNEVMFDLLLGTKSLFNEPHQTINYIECHDNYTFYDQMIQTGIDQSEIKYYQDLGNHLVAIASGVAFYHAGQEMYRTKDLVENSYRSNDSINGLKWQFSSSQTKLQELLKIREEYVNKANAKKAVAFKDGFIVYTIDLAKAGITIYIKNDFSEQTISNDNKLLFNSQDFKEEKATYLVNKPGIYIFSK